MKKMIQKKKYQGKYRRDKLFRGKIEKAVALDFQDVYRTYYSSKDGSIVIRMAKYNKEDLPKEFTIEWRKL